MQQYHECSSSVSYRSNLFLVFHVRTCAVGLGRVRLRRFSDCYVPRHAPFSARRGASDRALILKMITIARLLVVPLRRAVRFRCCMLACCLERTGISKMDDGRAGQGGACVMAAVAVLSLSTFDVLFWGRDGE